MFETDLGLKMESIELNNLEVIDFIEYNVLICYFKQSNFYIIILKTILYKLLNYMDQCINKWRT